MGKYRTKTLLKLKCEFLDPILEACNLKIREDGRIYYIGCDPDTPPLYIEEGSSCKTLVFVTDEEILNEFVNDKDNLKIFNPFVNIKHLRYLSDEIVRNLIHITFDGDDRRIFDIEGDIHEDVDLYRLIDIKRMPKTEDGIVENVIVAFDPDDQTKHHAIVRAKGTNSLSSLIMCFKKAAGLIDRKVQKSIDAFGSDVELDDYINDLLDKYENERRLNAKDLKKEKKDQKLIKANNLDIDYSGRIDVIANMIEQPIDREQAEEDDYGDIVFQ